MVEQPKYLEMTLSQLKAYVESSESNVLLVVESPKGDQNNEYCNISCSGISKIVSLRKANLYVDIICMVLCQDLVQVKMRNFSSF